MGAPKKKADPYLAQAEETLDFLRRLQAWVKGSPREPFPWALEVRLEEELEVLEERVDLWGQP